MMHYLYRCSGFKFFKGWWLLFLLLELPSCSGIRSLGKNPSGEALRKLESYPNYYNGVFHNLESFPDTAVVQRSRSPQWLRMIRYLRREKPATAVPSKPLPVCITDLSKNDYGAPTIIWFGHSTFLLKTGTANILFDPNFNAYAGPIKGLIPAFPGTNIFKTEDLPSLDAIVISHDHYDHLDYRTVKN